MLKVRIIPTLLVKEFGLVKGISFNSWRRIGSVLPSVKVFNSRDVDELLILDINASIDNNLPDYEIVNDFSNECFVPLTIGGGVKNLSSVLNLLHSGADKVSINTSTYNNPHIVDSIANQFGSQCVVVSIDYRMDEFGNYFCFSYSGTRKENKNPLDWAKEMESRGAGEIVLNSIDRDGTMKGYDLELLQKVSSAVNIPIIASGGAGNYQHMIDAVKLAGVSAVAASSMFFFTEQTPTGAKFAMFQAGIPIRKNFISEKIS